MVRCTAVEELRPLANDPRVFWLNEPAGLEAAFRSFTQSTSPAHERWTDGYLAAFAMASAAQLVTFDGGFGRFAGLDLLALNKYSGRKQTSIRMEESALLSCWNVTRPSTSTPRPVFSSRTSV